MSSTNLLRLQLSHVLWLLALVVRRRRPRRQLVVRRLRSRLLLLGLVHLDVDVDHTLEEQVDGQERRHVGADAADGDLALALDNGEAGATLDQDRELGRGGLERGRELGVARVEEDCERSSKGVSNSQGAMKEHGEQGDLP